jgi:hypothetical protein
MKASYMGCWRWLQKRAASAAGFYARRSGRRETGGRAFIAAQVETLESRQLLSVTYHGGALLPNVEAQAVYLGASWQSNPSLQTQKGQIETFVSGLVQSKFMDGLTLAGYNVYRGTSSAGVIDSVTFGKKGITDSQIQGDIQSLISAGQVQPPDANRLYVVYVQPGVVIHTSFGSSSTAFLAYHGAFAGHTAAGAPIDVHYAVIDYPGAPNFTSKSQGFASDLDEMTSVTAHELAEAATDPNVGYKTLGWYDIRKNGEIGDLTRKNTTLNGFLVQEVVNIQDVPIDPNAITQTVSTPPNVALSALSKTTAQLTWGKVALAQGYRIYAINGLQRTLVATLGKSATSFALTGLTPGAAVSYLVTTFDGPTTADAQVVGVTLPM